MSAVEQLADDLGQVIFRLETNFGTAKRTKNPDVRLWAEEAMVVDMEQLKDIKSRILELR